MRRCPECKSVWVCWNWINLTGTNDFVHECHNCSNTFSTEGVVDDGIPYNVLMEFGKHFVEPGRFELGWHTDLEWLEKNFGRKPNDK